jgi:hypothetical protein
MFSIGGEDDPHRSPAYGWFNPLKHHIIFRVGFGVIQPVGKELFTLAKATEKRKENEMRSL